MAWRTYDKKLASRYIELSDLPSQPTEYSTTLTNLYGGLNIHDLDYMLDSDESPEMKNLMWEDGMLCSRPGQLWNCYTGSGNSKVPVEFGTTHAAYERGWHDHIFAHLGNKIYCFKIDYDTAYASLDYTLLYTGGADFVTNGTFIPYNEYLLYKTKGYYIRITYNGEDAETLFTAENFGSGTFTGYTPITYINAAPSTGAGDVYQPENRLSSDKTIWYNAAYTVTIAPGTGVSLTAYIEPSAWKDKVLADGTYTLTYDGSKWSYTVESETTELTTLTEYGISITSGTPASGDTLVVSSYCVNEYHLPVNGTELVKVVVDGTTLTQDTHTLVSSRQSLNATLDPIVWRQHCAAGTVYTFTCQAASITEWTVDHPIGGASVIDPASVGISFDATKQQSNDTISVTYTEHDYRYNKTTGVVIFTDRPQVTVPATNNTVALTYRLANATAYNNIMDCRFAITYGGTGDMAVVVAGNETQPNAYFWCGQTSTAVDCTYFPMEQYQLASDITDPITGFGKQASYLIIFKKYSVGRTSYGTEEVNERTVIDLPYTPINARTGCDLPWTIQLVDDNLVWCNTDMGVHYLASTTASYENNIVHISEKVNGAPGVDGLGNRVRSADPEYVSSMDDGHRYYVCCGGYAWVWNYEISTYKDPSWFYYTGIDAARFVFERESLRHFDSNGRLTIFQSVLYDYDYETGAIEKVFKFAVQTFGTYDKLKNINSIIFDVRGQTSGSVRVQYITDYEQRYDLTDLSNTTFTMAPRDISGDTLPARDLTCEGFMKVYRRRPRCLRIRHFTVRLTNNTANEDLSIVAVQIFYTYQGRQR